MKFSEVIGQTALKKQLIRTVQENRISHAQLFAGPEGTGGLAMALAYAQYICCEARTSDDSCGVCSACTKISKLLHPDLHFVYPVVNTQKLAKAVSTDYIAEWRKAVLETPYFNLNYWIGQIAAENKQGGIFEAESGEIIRKLNLKTYESEYKVMIIWMVEKMNATAGNKLLKLLEEPPAKTLFLLVSENPGQLLATILSRCQLVKMPPIDNAEMRNAISAYTGDGAKLTETCRVAAGNYFKALELLNEGSDNTEMLNYFVLLMRLAFKGNVPELAKWAEELAGTGREKQKKFLMHALRLVRENYTLSVAGQQYAYLNDAEMEFSGKFHPFINDKNVTNLNEEFNMASMHIESNGNAKIIFFDLALKVVKAIRTQ